jgi:hypothetical protein
MGGIHGRMVFKPGVHPLVHLFVERPRQVLLFPLLYAHLKIFLQIDFRGLVEICNFFIISEEHLPFILACKCISVALVGFICIELCSQL